MRYAQLLACALFILALVSPSAHAAVEPDPNVAVNVQRASLPGGKLRFDLFYTTSGVIPDTRAEAAAADLIYSWDGNVWYPIVGIVNDSPQLYLAYDVVMVPGVPPYYKLVQRFLTYNHTTVDMWSGPTIPVFALRKR